MMYLVGKLPMFGKYVQMFRSVSSTIVKFFFPFVFIMIGFMMAFMILFSYQDPFVGFPSAFVKLIVMMLGEIDYEGLYYPIDQLIVENNGTSEIEEVLKYQPFPGTAQLLVILFVALVSIIVMNLLVGLAVSDIAYLTETGKRSQLVAVSELVLMLRRCVDSRVFLWLPVSWQHFIKTRLIRLRPLKPTHRVNIEDNRLPVSLKRTILKYLLRKKENEKKRKREKEIKEIKEQMTLIMNKLDAKPPAFERKDSEEPMLSTMNSQDTDIIGNLLDRIDEDSD